MSEFNTQSELAELKQQTKLIRKKRFSRSRLDKYTGELLTLYRAGASAAELQRWLRTNRIKVQHSTVCRWLDKVGAKNG